MRDPHIPTVAHLQAGPVIDGRVALILELKGFRPSRPRPDTVWIRGRRASRRRVAAILEPDGSLILHRQSRRGAYVKRLPDVAQHVDAIGPALHLILDE